ncbi:MAG: LacI family DNA-binding transcriptional regulator [Bacillota bacterium]
MRSTIYDVAERAGVSAKTVSRVINNSPLVAPETRRRVMAAIAELDYHPDSAAKGLRQRSRKSVGLVIPYGSDFVFHDPGMWTQANGAHRALAERGYDLVLAVPETRELVLHELNRLTKNRTVDGVILYAMEGVDALVKEFDRLGIRYVSLSTCYRGQKNNFVDTDSAYVGHLATRYMLDQGARRIGLIREPRRFFEPGKASTEQGYRRAHEEAGLEVNESLILAGDYSIESGYECACQLLSASPAIDGILCASDPMALGALRALRERGLEPGVDIDFVAGDDFQSTRAIWPGLTSIRTPLYEQGYQAGAMIVDYILTGREIPGKVLQGELIVRRSVRSRK